MSEELDALAESARNRGLKLVRSRVRTPGKPGFGRVGLAAADGTPAFGIKDGAPDATLEEVRSHLRTLGNSVWSESLGEKGVRRPTTKRLRSVEPAVARKTSKRTDPEPGPEPASEPVAESPPQVREAQAGDAKSLVALMALLGHETDAAGVKTRIGELAGAGEAPLVAVIGKTIVGLCGLHRMHVIHRSAPVGRITILVVDESVRGCGIGRQLVEAAETRLRDSHCGLLEVTSNDALTRAHAFYRHLGFERTGTRFAKRLAR